MSISRSFRIPFLRQEALWQKRHRAAENRRSRVFEREKRKSVSEPEGGDPASLRLI